MEKYEVLTIDDERWDSIVESFDNYSVHYLSGYLKAFQGTGEEEPFLFYYNDGKNRGLNVAFKRDISNVHGLKGIGKNKYFDLITPYGYGGFIFDGNSKIIQEAYNDYCKNNRIVCEFVRFNLFADAWKYYDGDTETRTHNIVRRLNIPLEDMIMDFKHKVRKNIHAAERNGLVVEIHEKDKETRLDDFLDIYYGTMQRNNAKDSFYFDKSFFEDINNMENNAAYFYVLSGDKVISTELVIYDKNNCYSYLGGTDSDYFPLRPNEILKYEIIKWAYTKNLKNFVLGGGYGSDDGIYNYKLGFDPNGVYDFYIGRKIFDRKLYDELCDLKGSDKNSQFFPSYRSN